MNKGKEGLAQTTNGMGNLEGAGALSTHFFTFNQ